jgi:hypothetical protein
MADIVKAGWLQRRTTILKNWKREWFILTSDARLRRVSSPEKQNDRADDTFQLERCREMHIGSEQVPHTIEPPNGSTREQLIELVPSNGDTWTLCAESEDDLLAWATSFVDVRQLHIERMHQQQAQWTNTQIPPARYDFVYYPGNYGSDNSSRIYRTYDGPTHRVILVDRDSYYDNSRDVAAGALTGMALGTLMFLPMLIVLPLMLL